MTYTVYTITNKQSGRAYYGRTKWTELRRWQFHVGYLMKGRHPNIELQRDWRKFGVAGFEFAVISTFDTKKAADSYETQLIASDADCYNERKKGGNSQKRYNDRGLCRQGNPLLTINEVREIEKFRGKLYGYQIAKKFGISPSLVSLILNGKYIVQQSYYRT